MIDMFDLMEEERLWPTTYEPEDTTEFGWTDDDMEDEFDEDELEGAARVAYEEETDYE